MTKLNMKTDQVIAVAVLVVVILIGIWYFSTNWTPTPPPAQPVTETGETTTNPVSPTSTTPSRTVQPAPAPAAPTVKTQVVLTGFNSLNYLRAQKEPLYCSISAVAAGEHRTGNVYVSGGIARADLATVPGGAKIGTSMIDDGTNLYAWHAGATTGIELLAAKSVNGSVVANYGAVDPASSFSFSCARWTTDSATLTPPSSVTFTKQ